MLIEVEHSGGGLLNGTGDSCKTNNNCYTYKVSVKRHDTQVILGMQQGKCILHSSDKQSDTIKQRQRYRTRQFA